MTGPEARVTAAWSSLVDSTASVVRSYAEAVLGCVEKTARFLVSLDLCAPSEAASEEARVELPQHAAKGQPIADITGKFGLTQAQEIKFEHAFDLPMTTASVAMQFRMAAGAA